MEHRVDLGRELEGLRGRYLHAVQRADLERVFRALGRYGYAVYEFDGQRMAGDWASEIERALDYEPGYAHGTLWDAMNDLYWRPAERAAIVWEDATDLWEVSAGAFTYVVQEFCGAAISAEDSGKQLEMFLVSDWTGFAWLRE